MNTTIITNSYLLKDWIDNTIQEKRGLLHIKTNTYEPKWHNNHELCIANYERMKQSRKRIIKQRDKLKKTNNNLYKYIQKLEEYKTLKNENTDLYQSLQSANAKIQKIQRQNNQYRREKEEYQRKYNLLKTRLKQLDGI